MENWLKIKGSKGIWGNKPKSNSKLFKGPKERFGMPVHLFGDRDRDGVANVFDCRPRNRRMQGKLLRADIEKNVIGFQFPSKKRITKAMAGQYGKKVPSKQDIRLLTKKHIVRVLERNPDLYGQIKRSRGTIEMQNPYEAVHGFGERIVIPKVGTTISPAYTSYEPKGKKIVRLNPISNRLGMTPLSALKHEAVHLIQSVDMPDKKAEQEAYYKQNEPTAREFIRESLEPEEDANPSQPHVLQSLPPIRKPVLKKVRMNKNLVGRFVDKETGEIHAVPSGVEDSKWGTPKYKKDYPQQYKAHMDYKRKQKLGDCFGSACNAVIDAPAVTKPHYVYGKIKPNVGPQVGKKFGHAWVEMGDVVVDESNKKRIIMRKEDYYEKAGVKEADLVKLSQEDTAKLMTGTGRTGPYTPAQIKKVLGREPTIQEIETVKPTPDEEAIKDLRRHLKFVESIDTEAKIVQEPSEYAWDAATGKKVKNPEYTEKKMREAVEKLDKNLNEKIDETIDVNDEGQGPNIV